MINSRAPSLERALDIFDLLKEEKSVSFSAIIRTFPIPKASLARILSILLNRDFLKKNDDKTYSLGNSFTSLAGNIMENLDIAKIGHKFLVELTRRTNESSEFVIYERGKILHLDKIEPFGGIKLFSRIGSIYTTLHASGIGKACLGFIQEDERKVFFSTRKLYRYTEKTITDKRKLKQEIKQIINNGYAYDDQEVRDGIRRFSAPVFDYTEKLVGAIGIIGQISRLPLSKKKYFGQIVKETALKLSNKLGFVNRKIRRDVK